MNLSPQQAQALGEISDRYGRFFTDLPLDAEQDERQAWTTQRYKEVARATRGKFLPPPQRVKEQNAT